jgi:hypothetical protein
MRSWKHLGTSALVAPFCAAALAASPVAAQNLDLGEMSAALALPVVTGEFQGNILKGTGDASVFETNKVVTLATVTNGRSTSVLLKVDVISGDMLPSGGNPEGANPPLGSDGDNWQSLSFECELTGRETATFVFVPPAADRVNPSIAGDVGLLSSELYVECSAGTDTAGAPRALNARAEVGILFVAAADPATGAVISEDILFGDAVIVDLVVGRAVSFDAIGFQAGAGANDGNKVYRFDNQEYASFPSVLATNFIAPDENGDILADLFLFTLDGATGSLPVPRVRLSGLAYDDDEEFFDFQWEFDCLDIVPLTNIDPNFTFSPGSALGFGSMSGHLQLASQPIATANDSHDAEHGDGNSIRRRGVHGWIVQGFESDQILYPDHPIPGTPAITQAFGESAFGRPLNQARTALVPFLADAPSTLDADPLN